MEAQHNIFNLKSVSWLVNNKITGLLDGYIFAALFETAYHCFCCLSLRYFISILVLQSSWWGRESWLLYFICLPGVSRWLSGSSSRCHRVVCGLWLWYFLIILTYYFLLVWLRKNALYFGMFFFEIIPSCRVPTYRDQKVVKHGGHHGISYLFIAETRSNL